MAFISQFPNLEKLILNGTAITGENLDILKSCKYLKELALINTNLSPIVVRKIGSIDFPPQNIPLGKPTHGGTFSRDRKKMS